MEKIKKVIGNTDIDIFDVNKGKTCTLLKSYWYNGEGWYSLNDENDNKFDSPDIFWDDVK